MAQFFFRFFLIVLPLVVGSLVAGAACAGTPPKGLYAYEIPKSLKVGAVLGDMPIVTVTDKLVAAQADICGRVEIHKMVETEGGILQMRKVPFLELSPRHPVILEPMGYHLMLMDLKQPMVAGNKIHLTLTFEKAGEKNFVVPILSRKASEE